MIAIWFVRIPFRIFRIALWILRWLRRTSLRLAKTIALHLVEKVPPQRRIDLGKLMIRHRGPKLSGSTRMLA